MIQAKIRIKSQEINYEFRKELQISRETPLKLENNTLPQVILEWGKLTLRDLYPLESDYSEKKVSGLVKIKVGEIEVEAEFGGNVYDCESRREISFTLAGEKENTHFGFELNFQKEDFKKLLNNKKEREILREKDFQKLGEHLKKVFRKWSGEFFDDFLKHSFRGISDVEKKWFRQKKKKNKKTKIKK